MRLPAGAVEVAERDRRHANLDELNGGYIRAEMVKARITSNRAQGQAQAVGLADCNQRKIPG